MNEQPDEIVLLDRESWLKERDAGLGSSDAAAILGASPWKSAFALYVEKLGLRQPSHEESEAMEWGRILEPIIATRYEQETQRPLRDPGRFTIQRSRRHPFMLATLDREILMPNLVGSRGVLEIKTTGRGDDWAEAPPLVHQIQLQHQLAVSGHAWGSLAVLIGGQRFLWLDMERNPRFIALLIEREEEFWDRIQRLEPPPPTGQDVKLLPRLYPRDDGEAITLPPEAAEWDYRLREAKDHLKHWQSVANEAQALLTGAIGSASVGILPDGSRYTWRASERAAYEVAASTVRTLRRHVEEPA